MNTEAINTPIEPAPEESPAGSLSESQNSDESLYQPTESVDDTLKTFANLLKIPPFGLLARVKIPVPSTRSYDNCFDITPSELPVVERIRREQGPGDYEIWVYHKGKLYKRLKLALTHPVSAQSPNKGYERPQTAPTATHGVEAEARAEVGPTGSLEGELASLRQQIHDLKRNNQQSRRGGHNQHQDPTKSMMSMVTLLKDIGVIPAVKPKEQPVEPPRSFDEILEERINTSKLLGFERPEGGTADMGNGSSFFDSEFAGEALEKLATVAQSGFGIWQMSVLNKQDELRMANGLPPLHMGGTADVKPPNKPKPEGEPSPSTTTKDESEMTPEQTDTANKQALEAHLHYLVNMAEAETETHHWAECTLDIFDEEFLQATILAPGALSMVLASRPDLEKYRGWFARFIRDMSRIIKDMDEKESTLDKNEEALFKGYDIGPDQDTHTGETNEKDVREESTPEKKRAGNRPGSGNTG